ncbi:hypothetical protein RSAG8_04761, partial [Rhizoctonia solani AG-8 WAC10335]
MNTRACAKLERGHGSCACPFRGIARAERFARRAPFPSPPNQCAFFLDKRCGVGVFFFGVNLRARATSRVPPTSRQSRRKGLCRTRARPLAVEIWLGWASCRGHLNMYHAFSSVLTFHVSPFTRFCPLSCFLLLFPGYATTSVCM